MEHAAEYSQSRIPPQDTDAERAVLGAILLDPNVHIVAFSILQPEYFYSSANEKIFEAMTQLDADKRQIDIITVKEQLKKWGALSTIGGSAYLNRLVNEIVSSVNIEAHCQIVAEKFMLRSITHISNELCAKGYDSRTDGFQLLADAQSRITEILTKFESHKIETAKEQVESVIKELQAEHFFETGFIDLDKHIQLIPQTLVTVGARPRTGKSLFALNIADYLSKSVPVLFFSLEMSRLGMHIRIMSKCSGYSTNDLLRNRDIQWNTVQEKTMDHLSRRALDFNFTPGLTVQEIRLIVLNYKNTHPDLALVIIDYVQLIRASKREHYSREQEVAEIVRGLIETARDANVCVITLAQLSRAAETRGGDKAPQLSDLRESGSLEQDSDVVLLLHRPELYNIKTLYDDKTDSTNKIEVRIAKNRNGIGGIVILGFNGERMFLENIQANHDSQVKKQLENWKPNYEPQETLPF